MDGSIESSWASLSDPSFKEGEISFQTGDSAIDTKFIRCAKSSECLIVFFHAAIDRAKFSLPFYSGLNHLFTPHAHQLSVSDPTMSFDEELKTGWYIGTEDYNTQNEFKAFIKQVKETLGIQRTLYVGGSTGGFASLYYSFYDDNSCAIALQPQISLALNRYRHTYLELCWSSRQLADISQYVCTDIGDLYKDDFNNSVIYLQ